MSVISPLAVNRPWLSAAERAPHRRHQPPNSHRPRAEQGGPPDLLTDSTLPIVDTTQYLQTESAVPGTMAPAPDEHHNHFGTNAGSGEEVNNLDATGAARRKMCR